MRRTLTERTRPPGRTLQDRATCWLGLRWVQAHTFTPTWATGRWRHPANGYALAVLAAVGAALLTSLLLHLFPHLALPSLLVAPVILCVALNWGAGPSLLAGVIGAVLLNGTALLGYAGPANVTTLARAALLVGGGVAISLLASKEVTARAALAQREYAARLEAEAALRVRDDFLLAASHDLRTPLTGVLGRAELLQRRLQGPEAPDRTWLATQVQAVHGEAQRLVRVVEQLTDAAQLQMGQPLVLQRERVDLGALAHTVASTVGAASLPQSAPIAVEAAPQHLVVWGDRTRLERVLQNIVGNAVKYSPQGQPVQLTVQAADGWVTLTVRDQGVGIPAAELPLVFRHFYRASTARGIPGQGIGLAGAKAMVEQHGGHVAIASVVGQGTTVRVALPAGVPFPGA